jgi:hypothetical protein
MHSSAGSQSQRLFENALSDLQHANDPVSVVPPREDCPQRRFLDTKGEGVFHISFEVPDCDAGEAEADARGVKVQMRGRRSNGSAFTYFDTASAAGVILEIWTAPPVEK